MDTSVWLEHLSDNELILTNKFESGSLTMHAMIIGKLACGTLSNFEERIRDWYALTAAAELKKRRCRIIHRETNSNRARYRDIDANLFNAVENHGDALLWTGEKNLLAASRELNVAYSE